MTGLGALSFASPLILLALAALPALWLLLRATPPAPQRVKFPPLIILRKLSSAEQTPARTPWWLLLLRLLIAAIAILALAGPVLNAPPRGNSSGPLLLVVDNSWAAADRWKLRLDALRAGAEEAETAGRLIYIALTAGAAASASPEPLSGAAAMRVIGGLAPEPFRADRAAAARAMAQWRARGGLPAGAEIRWLSDGLAGDGDEALLTELAAAGETTLQIDRQRPTLVLRPAALSADGLLYRIDKVDPAIPATGAVVALARDGRELGRAPFTIASGETSAEALVRLPLALRNQAASARIESVASAGAVQLIDSRDRRAFVGIIAGAESAGDELLTGAYYVRKALLPYAEVESGPLDVLLKAEVSAIVLDDIGRLRPGDLESLKAWIESGGVAIRFAGPNLADAAQDEAPPLLPVQLRGGGRAFGGALTWDTPQRIASFPDTSPFSGLAPPADLFVREQVLAAPGPETSERTWASLEDGTPIVTGERIGAGALALFHVPATPGWSDLPLSSLYVDMLRRLIFLSVIGPRSVDGAGGAPLQPLRMLDGFGRFARPSPDAPSISLNEAALGPAPGRPPGFYGAPEAPVAVNAVSASEKLEPMSLTGVATAPYGQAAPVRLAPPLIALALVLFAVDALLTLLIAGRLRFGRAAAAMLALAVSAGDGPAAAQPLDAPIDGKVEASALRTRLAYVATGDPAVDRMSEQGLSALTQELVRRTALEPQAPVRVDPETDDLSVYPLIYWPVIPDARPPSELALANIENFMRFGGLILFDTRDDERAIGSALTPERAALRQILAQVDVPPLAPLPADHVLTRSFYLLRDLSGRTRGEPVFVQAAGSANDGVTPIIIGGRDWASAWAADEFGRPLRPVSGRGDCGRDVTVQECAYRAGVNIAMVAYTGNYKADQVHTPILLQRLGR